MSSVPPITCSGCRFDAHHWSDERVVGTFRVMGALWRGYLEGIDGHVADTRSNANLPGDPSTWSILEYVDHVREATWNARFLVDLALADPGVDVGPAATTALEVGPQRRFSDLATTVRSMEEISTDLSGALVKLTAAEWETPLVVHGERVEIRRATHHALHEALHHLRDVAEIRRRLGDGVDPQQGTVAHLAAGPGGVPKLSVDSITVRTDGIEGDRQNDLLHHGRPFQAVCLWGTDVLGALRAEGHPIFPGAAGENITVDGVAWNRLRPGARARVGDQVELELSSYAIPCAKNAQWFADRNFRRIDQEAHPGGSRLYAWIVQPGTIRVGDVFEVDS